MTEANDVPDWAIEKALIEPNENSPGSTGSKWTVKEIKEANGTLRYATAVMAFARYIAAHEKPPVDPDLLIAREAAAQVYDEGGHPNHAKGCRDGRFDGNYDVTMPLRAIKLYKERSQCQV
jgi:hypothetical protein